MGVTDQTAQLKHEGARLGADAKHHAKPAASPASLVSRNPEPCESTSPVSSNHTHTKHHDLFAFSILRNTATLASPV